MLNLAITPSWRGALVALLAPAALALAGCGAGQSSPTATIAPPPTVAISPETTTLPVGGATKAFVATVANTAGASITWQVNGVTGGNATVGTIQASGLYVSPPAVPSPATVTITAVAAVDGGVAGNAAVTLTPTSTPEAVTVSPGSATLQVGTGSQAFTATVTNASNTTVTWTVNGVTGGDATVGTISTGGVYTAPATAPAQPTVTVAAVSVADPTKSATAAVTLTATAPPLSITIAPTSATLALGSGKQQFTATDGSGASATVTWQVNGVTGGASGTGKISTSGLYSAPTGAPTAPSVTVTAVSTADATKMASATVTFFAPAPTISGKPPSSTLAGRVFDFKPAASDPSGLALSFTVSGKPAWANFNAATGELSGTPAASDAASYPIVITASNGQAQATLSFSVAVVLTAPGAATLTWTPPTTHTDGTALSNLAGFHVYFGQQVAALTNRIDVTNATVATSIVSNLTPGTWYFAVAAYDGTGAESGYSNIGSKTL